MANTPWAITDRGTKYRTLTTTEVIPLGDADNATVSQWAVKVKITGAGGSFIPKIRLIGSGLSGGDLDDTVYYTADSETAIAAGVASSAANIYYIPADACDVFLDYTQGTGSMTIYVYPFQG